MSILANGSGKKFAVTLELFHLIFSFYFPMTSLPSSIAIGNHTLVNTVFVFLCITHQNV